MSFFFDVWTTRGFVLAGDVRLSHSDGPQYAHKLRASRTGSAIPCAIATCGAYPTRAFNYFDDAVARKDTLREIAHAFAERWTEGYAGAELYSAVHLVGFEKVPSTDLSVPQLWYWFNWDIPARRYLTSDELHGHLDSFSGPTPYNDHIPNLLSQHSAQLPRTLLEEHTLVTDFLTQSEPFFTWNGDTAFWRSAAQTVGSVMDLLRPHMPSWDLDTTWQLAKTALEFLAKLGAFLPDTTVTLSPNQECDVLTVVPARVDRRAWSNLPDEH